MKRFILRACYTVAALGFMASCTSERTKVDHVNPSEIITKLETCDNADSIRVYVKAAHNYVAKLAYEDKLDSAQSFMNQIVPIVEKRDPALLGLFKSVEGVIVTASAESQATMAISED